MLNGVHRVGIVLLVLLVLSPITASAADPLSGAWRVNGRLGVGETPKLFNQEGFADLNLTFGKGTLTVNEQGKAKPRSELKFTADAGAKPKSIDLEVTAGVDKGKKLLGTWSYCPDEDVLKLYLTDGKQRPDPQSPFDTKGNMLQLNLARPR